MQDAIGRRRYLTGKLRMVAQLLPQALELLMNERIGFLADLCVSLSWREWWSDEKYGCYPMAFADNMFLDEWCTYLRKHGCQRSPSEMLKAMRYEVEAGFARRPFDPEFNISDFDIMALSLIHI